MTLRVSEAIISQPEYYGVGSKDDRTSAEATENQETSPLAKELSQLSSSLSVEKNRVVMVRLPATELSVEEYEIAFLQSALQEVGLKDASATEIAGLQREYQAITGKRLGLEASAAELRIEQARRGDGSLMVKVSDYDLAVLSIGKKQILQARAEQAAKVNSAMEGSKYYAEDAIAGFYKLQVNGVINVVNATTRVLAVPEIEKFAVQGEYWQDKKEAVEMGTTMAAGVLTRGLGAGSEVATGLNVAADSVEAIRGKDYRSGRELSNEERILRGLLAAGGIASLAEPVDHLTGKAIDKLDDWRNGAGSSNGTAVELVTPEGVKLPVADLPEVNGTELFNRAHPPKYLPIRGRGSDIGGSRAPQEGRGIPLTGKHAPKWGNAETPAKGSETATGGLKGHAHKHLEASIVPEDPELHYAQAVGNINFGNKFTVWHNGQLKNAYVTQINDKQFLFTSTTQNNKLIFTHYAVTKEYLKGLGITLKE